MYSCKSAPFVLHALGLSQAQEPRIRKCMSRQLCGTEKLVGGPELSTACENTQTIIKASQPPTRHKNNRKQHLVLVLLPTRVFQSLIREQAPRRPSSSFSSEARLSQGPPGTHTLAAHNKMPSPIEAITANVVKSKSGTLAVLPLMLASAAVTSYARSAAASHHAQAAAASPEAQALEAAHDAEALHQHVALPWKGTR